MRYHCTNCHYETDVPVKLRRKVTFCGVEGEIDVEVCPECGELLMVKNKL
jgi:DNA-directed RNA polymerase subunit RPC12/RpoP